MKHTKIEIKIPALMIEEEGQYRVFLTNEGKSLMDDYYGCGKTPEEAINEFWKSKKVMDKYYELKSKQADRWTPFTKGNWKHTGGTWFSIYGIHFYFRKGKNMKGGKYVPFTLLNIMITNYWKTNEPTNIHSPSLDE